MKILLKTPFGLLATGNLVLLPLHFSLIVRDYYMKFPLKIQLHHWGVALMSLILFFVSCMYYMRDIDLKTGEFTYKGHRVQVTEGDKLFINLFRKPYAFFIQLFVSLMHFSAIIEIFDLKL